MNGDRALSMRVAEPAIRAVRLHAALPRDEEHDRFSNGNGEHDRFSNGNGIQRAELQRALCANAGK